ncbi:UNVERIFIED_CONTAM: hypothetical protein GTU68_002703 [Idotea baltica]|nr:hypothetical protein [Idotea baltica]
MVAVEAIKIISPLWKLVLTDAHVKMT